MPEPILYMRGFPSPLTGHPTANPKFVEDLKILASLQEDQTEALNRRLDKAEGFLSPKALLATIREVIPDSNTAEAVRRVLRILDPSDIEEMVTDLEENKEEEGFPFDQASLDRLKQVLSKLIQPYPALTRFEKAEGLAKITGQPLETVELICDIRPIFDESREALEGMMPYTLLRIVATGVDGLPKSFEAQLTHQQLHNLAEKVEKAKRKLETLRQSVEKWGPNFIPDLPLTRTPYKEPSDA